MTSCETYTLDSPAATTNTTANSSSLAASSSNTVKAVLVRCAGDRGGPPWEATTIPTDHAVFNNTVPPVAALLDFPIVIHRLGMHYNGEFGNLDNQIIAYLNVEAKSGLAPPRWQSGIGSVIVARKDRKDLSPEHYEAIWMYHDHLLDYFGEGPAPEHLYNRKAFDRWFVGYAKDTAGFGRKEWNSVAPLY